MVIEEAYSSSLPCWGCKVEVRPYSPQSKKLDPKTIGGYFIGYCLGSRGSSFYCLSHTTKVIELDGAIYFEDDTSISQGPREIVFKEYPIFILGPIAYTSISSPVIDQHLVATTDDEPIENVDLVALDVVMDVPLRTSERAPRPTIAYDYIVYL